jgi:tripartite-type tricarboxylate transporter receptor subunit TctC
VKFDRRVFLAGTAGWGLTAGLPRVWAQAPFPSKPIKIVVPNAAGGAADITARTIAEKISRPLGQSVVIENKPSAGGIVAGQEVARADPDGHTMLLVSSGTAVSASLFKSLPFDTVKDFAPVSQLATFDLAILVAEGGRFKTLKDLLAYARAHPGKLNLGTPQIGTTQNLSAELFKSTAGIDFQIVPFNGTPPVTTALRGGQLDAMIDILGPVMPQITSHALRPLAVMGRQRAPQLPDVPTVAEEGPPLGNFDVSSWNGLSVPARTPPAVIARLNHEIQAALAQPDVQKRFLDLNLVAKGGTPQQLEERLTSDIRRWSDVIARAKIARQ